MSRYDQVLLFSPQNCALSVLEANLTAKRRKLAEAIAAGLRQAAEEKSSRYDLIIGPRGAGKTHVAAYVEQKLAEPTSGAGLRVIRLSEEEFGVTCHADLLLAALRAAGDDIDDLYETILEKDGQQRAESRLIDNLHGSPGLLIVENLATLLEAMDEGEHRKLRGFLQRNPRLSVLATSPRLFMGSGGADHPFYNFFMIHTLEPLGRVESRDFLLKLAEWKGDSELATRLREERAQARINAVHDMTGGNHRLLGMLSDCLRAEDFETLVEPFVRMVDRELTPYFQQRLMSLPDQQAKILRVIARHQTPVQVKEIARKAMATEQTTSSQLRALREAGLVRSTQQGRESHYELQEPMMRIVLDIKEGREQALPSVVALLREWYEAEELRSLVECSQGFVRDYYQAALEEKLARFVMRGSLPEEVNEASAGDASAPLERLINACRLVSEERYAEARPELDSIILDTKPANDEVTLKKSIVAKLMRALALHALGEQEASIYDCIEIVKDSSSQPDPEIQVIVAFALQVHALALAKLGHFKEALDAWTKAIEQFESRDEPEILTSVALAMDCRGFALVALGQIDEAICAYHGLLSRFAFVGGEAYTDPCIRGVSGLLGLLSERPQRIREILESSVPEDILLQGLTHFVQSKLPMDAETARGLERTERALDALFADRESARRVLEIFRAARAHSLGDKKALLRLPIESRRLVERAYGLAES